MYGGMFYQWDRAQHVKTINGLNEVDCYGVVRFKNLGGNWIQTGYLFHN